jgi:hypothetical protein
MAELENMAKFKKNPTLFSSYCQAIYMLSIIGKQCKRLFSPTLVATV